MILTIKFLTLKKFLYHIKKPFYDFKPDKSRIAEIRARTAAAIFALASKISKKNAIQDTTSAELASENKVMNVG